MIPEAAIEAAHRAWREQAKQDGTIFEYNLRAAIEAAAPHMADSWHDAVASAYVEGSLSADQASIMWNKNPYRPAK